MTSGLARRLEDFLLEPEARAAPYAMYGELHRAGRAVRLASGTVVVWGHDAATAVLRDPKLGKGPGSPDDLAPRPGRDRRAALPPAVFTASLVHLNPPEHTRLREPVARAFARSRIEALRPMVTATADRLLDDVAARDQADLLAEVALGVPVWVIGEVLGIPPDERAAFGPLVRDQALLYEPGVSDEEIAAGMRAAREMAARLAPLLRERRRRPTGDLLSELVADDPDGPQPPLTRDEVVGLAMLLLGAGFETTSNLIGNAFATLLARPDDVARLGPAPDLVPAAVEEVLRFESPVQLAARVALAPTTAAGEPVEPGDWVVALLGAANRDPACYADPDRFSLDRFAPATATTAPPPLSFSVGIHHCLGAPLARLEASVVVERWLARGPDLALVDADPAWRPHITSRGLRSLPVRVRSGSPSGAPTGDRADVPNR